MARRRPGVCRWLLAAALLAGPFAAAAGAQVRSNGDLEDRGTGGDAVRATAGAQVRSNGELLAGAWSAPARSRSA